MTDLFYEIGSHNLNLVVKDVSKVLEARELFRVLPEAREAQICGHQARMQGADLDRSVLGLHSNGPGEIGQEGLRGSIDNQTRPDPSF